MQGILWVLLREAYLFSEHSFSVKIQSLCPITVFTYIWCKIVGGFSVDFVSIRFTCGACHRAYRRSRLACEHCSTKDWKLCLSFLREFSVKTEAFKYGCWKASVVSRTWKENNTITSHLFFYCFSLCNLLLAVYFALTKQTPLINCTSLDIVSSANMASAKNKVIFWALFGLNFC